MTVRQTRYQALAEALERDIAGGVYPVGSKLPKETELCEQHGMSRGTVRQALQHLENLGMIERRARAGTTVLSREPENPYVQFVSSKDEIITLVEKTKIRRPSTGEVVADFALAARLDVEPGSRWFLVAGPRYLRTGSKQPLCWSDQYIRAEAPGRERLLRGDFDRESLRGHTIEQEVRAAMLTDDVAAALDAEPRAPALVITRRHYATDGAMLSVSFHIHPADRYSIRTTLTDS
ncbi:GntR family transcriptional regulator [Rhodococcus sp. OK519]|uniref:GntR family transcriptional regulator n=1 Tax=Rhodococcus sp. OK519 TaxID=2135729 RepID=UPI000D381163|nr:GntR family transcriptional regulator [Rhodococcus sp. OK519]